LPEDLHKIADMIIRKFVTPLENVGKAATENPEDDSADEMNVLSTARTCKKHLVPPVVTVETVADPDKDKAHQNSRLLTRDLLYLLELIRAISDGDIDRVEDLLPQLAMMFRGAGSNNYCTEILHFILNLKYVWTPEFAYVKKRNYI
jgi:hypothetical protein